MSAPRKALLIAAPLSALVLLLTGCSYDSLQHTDRIAYSAGDAVKANLEGETTHPDGKNAYNTSGLGANGPQGDSASASAP
jgi:hypothetical protein